METLNDRRPDPIMVRLEHLHACLPAIILHPLHGEQICDHLGIVDIRTGVTLGCIRHNKCQRLAEDLPGSLRLAADIQHLGLDLLHDQGHFAIAESLRLRAEINEGRIHFQLAPHLSRLRHHLCSIQTQAGFHHRPVDLRGNLVQIMSCHALVKDDHRRDLYPKTAGLYLTGQGTKQPSTSAYTVSGSCTGSGIEHHTEFSRTRHPGLFLIPKQDLPHNRIR